MNHMDKHTKREVVAALIKAGRRDLATMVAADAKAGKAALKMARQLLNIAQKHHGKDDKEFLLSFSTAIIELAKVAWDFDEKASRSLEDAGTALLMAGR
jgi:hypothetical protein